LITIVTNYTIGGYSKYVYLFMPRLDFKKLILQPELLALFRGRSPAHDDLRVELTSENDSPTMHIPYQKRFSRGAAQPALHGGIVMMAMDSAMGLATILALDELSSLATLELRYDELRCPDDQSGITIDACCESIDNGIAYLKAVASDSSGTFAKAVGRFILMPGSQSFIDSAMLLVQEQE